MRIENDEMKIIIFSDQNIALEKRYFWKRFELFYFIMFYAIGECHRIMFLETENYYQISGLFTFYKVLQYVKYVCCSRNDLNLDVKNQTVCVIGIKSFTSAFLFSIETQVSNITLHIVTLF